MDEEGFKGLPRARISSSKKSLSSEGRQATFPKTPSVRSSAYSESLEEAEKNQKISSASQSFGEKIRSSLPNIGSHLRRLMKFKNQRQLRSDESTTEVPKSEVAGAMPSLNDESRVEIGEGPSVPDEDNDESLLNSLEIQDFSSSQLNLDERQVVQSIASTSASLSEPQTSEFSIESDLTISGIFGQSVAPPNNLMISSGAEAAMDQLSNRFTLENVVTDEGAIITSDPLDFAAALNAQLGYARIRTYAELQARREHEPRSVPLLFYQDEPRDSYMGSSTAGVHGSSTSGSENSSVDDVSEVMEDNTEDDSLASGRRSDERDETQQFYDAALRAAVRKQFRHLDDEPPIY